ncbi:methylated-DNA--[protein]-cysteine S-methyltransferase [Ulvibacter litoralis]|uniref:Methylated-DNA--protein-cysteine methyltransferase n=1 Tax=Ulvibacter litoralis TaxID=227084 RepID=A0A1G7D417_9FLAO|nr:methylated-DNA--[protein]-cysteine S-methyltransferase [Ulvibacter litoralis]GHC44888.1 methylated-DNA--protein-cysteine methyltransferase [Ulvibacter litoralis]SDE46414.1 methylated-DNA-[protein]-cysteine S-methyltransferase [Ulvibacter litoralis]
MKTAYLATVTGTLEIKGDENGLASVYFLDSEIPSSEEIPSELQAAVTQLTEYFEGNRTIFNLPLAPEGTEFQNKVWNQLQTIPFGKTTSYQQMANQLGDPKVIRAAASANGKNPISIIIPCHRVIGSDGSLTGYAGGLHRKKWLLAHESPVTQGSLF